MTVPPSPAGPTPAERARTVLQSAPVLEVTAAGVRWTVVQHGADRLGRPVLSVAGRSPLAAVLATAGEPVPVLVHAARLRPQGGPDRVRARIELLGWLDVIPVTGHRAAMAALSDALPTALDRLRAGSSLLRAEIVGIVLDGVAVDPAAYERAEPDPLADHEGPYLRDLVVDRPDELARLCTLLEPGLVAGAAEIAPTALDRYGITVRIGRPDGDSEVRLTFRAPLTAARELDAAVRQLVDRCPAGKRVP